MDKITVVTIQLDRVRELRFGHRAMKRWSAHTGRDVQSINTSEMGPEDIEVLCFFMLEKDAQLHGEELKLEQMEELLDMAPLGTVYKKVNDAIIAAFPDAQEIPAAKNGKRAAAGTGKNT